MRLGPIRRWLQRSQRRLDVALAAAMVAGGLLTVLTSDKVADHRGLTGAVVVAMTGALVFRRRHALAVALFTCGCAGVMTAFLTAPPDVAFATFTIMIAGYSAGSYETGRRAKLGVAAIMATIVAACLATTPEDVAFPVIVFGLLPWVGGRMIRNHTLLTRELAEKAELVAHLGDERERDAVAAERVRVARELHDVLAHDLSVMVIQAQGAERMLDRDPAAAAEAAELIAQTGRDALAELRQLFGTVHRGEGEALSGAPGLGQLESLLERARAAGLPVTLRREGITAAALPPGVDIAAYRIVQEALTNTYKHAGRARAIVTLTSWEHMVMIEVVDDGRGSDAGAAAPIGGGHGLLGMRERAEVFGGEVEAGPRHGGGFRVVARLPVESPASTGVPA